MKEAVDCKKLLFYPLAYFMKYVDFIKENNTYKMR